jgi:hypothetical protein
MSDKLDEAEAEWRKALDVERELRRLPAGDRSWCWQGYKEGVQDMRAGKFAEARQWLDENADRTDEPTVAGYIRAIRDCLGGEK